jgi:transcription antitermination factor NusG
MGMSFEEIDRRWIAVQVRPRAEKKVAQMLGHKGYEEFLPIYRRRRRAGGRNIDLELPLFPGYVFCRFNLNIRAPILTTPGIIRLLGAGGMPIPVDDSEIESLQRITASGCGAQPWPFLSIGQHVHINSGPLSGTQGLVLRLKGGCRLVVSVVLLQRAVAVEVDEDWVDFNPEDRTASGAVTRWREDFKM